MESDSSPSGAPPRTKATEKFQIEMTVNGVRIQREVAPWTTLLDFLRDNLDLTGTKKGCDHGQCGACTVLVDGRRINSCMTFAVMRDGASVTSIEGLAAMALCIPCSRPLSITTPFNAGIARPVRFARRQA